MTRNWQKFQQGQGLVEYALLLTLVSFAAILGLEVFGDALAAEYCDILSALGTTESFCPAADGGTPGDPSDEGDEGGPTDPGGPGNPGNPGNPGDGDDEGNTGDDEENGGDEPGPGGDGEGNDGGDDQGDDQGDDENDGNNGGGDDQGDEGNNQPPQDEPQPGVITLFQVQAKNNKNHKEVWFTAQFNGDYIENVVLTATLGGESKVMMRENGNKYRAAWQQVSFPVELVIRAHDHEGRYLDAELRYTIRGDENGRFDG